MDEKGQAKAKRIQTKALVEFGRGVGKFGYTFTQEVGGMALQALASRFASPDIEKLHSSAPYHETDIGLAAVHRGRKEDIPELEFTGEALAVAAVLRASRNPNIPRDTVDQVVSKLIEAGIDPELSPLVPDEQAVQAQQLMRQSAPTPLFPNQPGRKPF